MTHYDPHDFGQEPDDDGPEPTWADVAISALAVVAIIAAIGSCAP